MAGTDTGFDAAEFRTAIRFAMNMGSPNVTLEKTTFRWSKVQTFNPQDPAHRPYRWSESVVTDTTPADVVMSNVAVEISPARTAASSDVGSFVPLRAELTMLDLDYALVRGADVVLMKGDSWQVTAVTTQALFSVDVYTIYATRESA